MGRPDPTVDHCATVDLPEGSGTDARPHTELVPFGKQNVPPRYTVLPLTTTAMVAGRTTEV
jgi:hypothetical protein